MPYLPLLLLFSSFFQTSRLSLTQDLPQAPFSFNSQTSSSPWDLPSPNSTDHLIFSSQLPTTPEWTALDPEFSYMFCIPRRKRRFQGKEKVDEGRSAAGGGCWHLTLRTTRPLNILYFDGSSAAKTYGSLDAQDLIVFGGDLAYDGTDRDSPSRVFDESERLRRLWMQSSFEVMLLRLSRSGWKEVSFLNLRIKEERDGREEPDQPTLLKVYGSIDVGLRHGSSSPYSSPETRVHLDFTRLISFYDTSLFPSLADRRERAPSKATSPHNSYNARNRFQKGLLDTSSFAPQFPTQILTQRTGLLLGSCSNHFVPSSSYALTPSERLLVSGLRGTTREICRVLVHLWALGAESNVGLEGISALSSSQIRDLHETYIEELTSLVSWLDWSTPFEETCYLPTWPFFHNLDPVIPGLPMRNWPSKPPARNASGLPPDLPAQRGDKGGDVDASEWLFPQPRCIRRIFPLHLP
ncbi:hypothetical protein FA13DRAFT_1740164 [Coprinellus micaceus]|uniref:Uncharacterized protein n=1 Tax=Coprinellus micaceus TaxID=71717 RepID=A0A4Y7SN37_COPMI|nr:hypothetical protein FA13DRAFT_1740164 [Coprinellus micaceus]